MPHDMDVNAIHLAAYRRALKAKGRSEQTIVQYEGSILQLAAHHSGADVFELTRADIENYLIAVLALPQRRRVGHAPGHVSATAGARFRALRAFFNWAVAEEMLDGPSPMARMKEPKATDAPVPVLTDDDLRALLKVCSGKDFEGRRDTAIIRLFCEPGSPRVSEMAGLRLNEGLDLRRDQVRVYGKGNKIRDIPFGPKTGQALDRYLLVRRKHRLAARPELWLSRSGSLTPSGIEQMLRRRSRQAEIGHVHPHQLRHTAAHVWHDQGGSEADAMALFGWSSAEMPRRYGASARLDRAQRAARRTTMADRL